MRVTAKHRLILQAWAAMVFLWLAGIGPPVAAQNVRWESSGYGLTRRHADQAAEKQGRADWPRIADGETGTQVHVTFDLRNADIVLMTGLDFGQQRLLAQARRIAPQIGRPRADYILFTGTKTVTTDIELNKYLARPSRRHSASDLDLSALAAALQASSLPRPIVLFVDAEDADTALLSSPQAAPRRLGASTFLGLGDVRPGTRLHFAASIPWYAPLVGILLVFAGLFALGMMLALPWQIARRRARQAAQPVAPLSPEEVQWRYDRQSPLWRLFALLPLGMIALSTLGNPKRVMEAAIYSLPFDLGALDPSFMFVLPLGLFALFGLSYLACRLVERRRGWQTGPHLAPTTDPDDPPSWTRTWFPLTLAVVWVPIMLLPLLLTRHILPRGPWVQSLPWALPCLFIVVMAVGGWRASRAVRTNLPPDDPWRRMVDEVAAQAGVRVKHVVRVQSPAVNAYASLFGTVGLTAGLLRKMEPEEVRVVIAHEIGHLRGCHVRRGFFLSLTVLAAFWGAWWYGLYALRSHLSDTAYALLSGPMVGIFLLSPAISLLLGRGRRSREAAADRFAAQVTGDPERVIQTLTKLHTLNASPHRLKPSDEMLSSHPSLVNRIAALRQAPPEPSGQSNREASHG